MTTSAERMRAFRARKQDQGVISVTVLVRDHQAAAIRDLAKVLVQSEDYELQPTVRNVTNGRFLSRREMQNV